MKLFMLHRCPFGHRATIVLQEKKLAFETVFFQMGMRTPEMEAVGPYAKSPTLVDGDAEVWDTQIVIEYLDDRYPTPSLMPADAAQRAEVRMLAARVAPELFTHFVTLVKEIKFKPQPDEATVAEAQRAFLDALGGWDRHLEGRKFLVGDALSLADVTLYTIFPAIRDMVGVEIPAERKNLRAWLEHMAARPTTRLLEPT